MHERAAGVELGGAGLLAEADDDHLRAAALDRARGTRCAASSGSPAGCGRRPRRGRRGAAAGPDASWATTTVSIEERISASRASAVMPSLASVASWPSAVAPPWLPIAGTTNGAAPRSRSPAIAPRSSSTRAGQTAAAGPDGDGHPVGHRAGEALDDLVAGRRLDVGDRRAARRRRARPGSAAGR